MELLLQQLQQLLCPDDSSIADLLESEQIYLRPAASEEALHDLDRANVQLAHDLQQLIQVWLAHACPQQCALCKMEYVQNWKLAAVTCLDSQPDRSRSSFATFCM